MTQIEWTHIPGYKGETWNPFVGCAIVSKGCTNCYAMKLANRVLDGNPKSPQYLGTTTVRNGKAVWTGKMGRASDKAVQAPLRATKPRCYFVNSMGDVFAEGVPDAWIDEALSVISRSRQHLFLLLTKRPERMLQYFNDLPKRQAELDCNAEVDWCDLPLPNLWLGVSVEDQTAADERIPLLLRTPAAKRFISAEPLLGPVDLDPCLGGYWHDFLQGRMHHDTGNASQSTPSLDWVIVGGESGRSARPMQPEWARSLRDQCARAGVPFFFKQWGEWAPVSLCDTPIEADRVLVDGRRLPFIPAKDDGVVLARMGKHAAGSLLDGQDHRVWPTLEPIRTGYSFVAFDQSGQLTGVGIEFVGEAVDAHSVLEGPGIQIERVRDSEAAKLMRNHGWTTL